ncbi:MAG TPA: hypothetical protein DCM73_08910 [Clostridiales bacterium]|nr:hypothetical protein [Clostridiales bacterium]
MNETDIKKEDVSNNAKENLNIIEEMKTIEQQMKDPNVHTFKKTINWNQQNINKMNQNQEAMLKEISECLLRIESKLDDLLEK